MLHGLKVDLKKGLQGQEQFGKEDLGNSLRAHQCLLIVDSQNVNLQVIILFPDFLNSSFILLIGAVIYISFLHIFSDILPELH